MLQPQLCFFFPFSPQGLLRATKVLQEAYGSMHVIFGRPLSVRQLCEGKINRCQYNLVPRSENKQTQKRWMAEFLEFTMSSIIQSQCASPTSDIPSFFLASASWQGPPPAAQCRGPGLRELAGPPGGADPGAGLPDQPLVSDVLPATPGSQRGPDGGGAALAAAGGGNPLAQEVGAGLWGPSELAR